MSSKKLRMFCTLAMILPLVISCGGDETPTEPNANPLVIQLPTTNGHPLDLLPITGLSGDANDFHMEIVSEDGAVLAGAPVLDFEGDFFFPLPFHPNGSPDGGQVDIRVADATGQSQLFSMTIQPLAEATTTLAEIVSLISENLELYAELMDTDIATLAELQWDALEPRHIPLRVVWSILADPANDNRLAELAEGRAPAIGEGQLNVVLLERTLNHIGLAEILTADHSVLNDLVAKKALQNKSQIETIEELAAAMTRARSSAARLDPDSAVQQVNRDLATAMTILGFIPHPAAQATSAGVGAIQFAYSTARQSLANLLPSQFVELAFQVSNPFFNEDSEETGTWSEAQVIATSLGWQLDATVVDGLLTLGGVGSAYSGWMNRFESITSDAWMTTLRDFLVNNNLKDLVALGDGQVFEIDPELFGPINATGLPWTRGYSLTEVISITGDQQYIPLEIGTDQLEIRSGEGLYGGAYVETAQTIEVRAITVDLDPNGGRVDNPGDLITLQATVQNADDTGLFWNIAPATWASEPVVQSPGVEIATIMTPLGGDDFPFQITVTSTASGGLRAGSTEQRFDAAIITTGSELQVDPSSVCLSEGETFTFSAYLNGEITTDVTWSLASGGGSISASTGTYTPPGSGQGVAVVVATSTLDDSMQASATARYGTCTCFWSATVGSAELEGTEATISSGLVIITLLPSPDEFFPNLQLWADGMQFGPGSYPLTTLYHDASGNPWSSENLGDNIWSTTVAITALTDTYVEGSFGGYLINMDEDQLAISGSFHAAVYSGSGLSPCRQE